MKFFTSLLSEIFQSTLPVGGATSDFLSSFFSLFISIHAPRGGSDCYISRSRRIPAYFNPRSPWGERLLQNWSASLRALFQSTLPVGGATGQKNNCRQGASISIHAPRGGSDLLTPLRPLTWFTFQSTLPVGGATITIQRINLQSKISIHAPRGGSDRVSGFPLDTDRISIHAPRGGSDSYPGWYHRLTGNFNPRSPWGERPRRPSPSQPHLQFQSTLPVGGATL